jgi:hypothetical protein
VKKNSIELLLIFKRSVRKSGRNVLKKIKKAELKE